MAKKTDDVMLVKTSGEGDRKVIHFKLPKSPEPALFAVKARSIYRKSRADEGRQGIWLLIAKSEDEAQRLWQHEIALNGGEWLFESASRETAVMKRVF